MRAAIAQKGANTSPAHRRRAAARGRCEKAGQDADGSRRNLRKGGQARRFVILGISSHRAPAAFSRSLPARTRVPARRRPRCPPPSPCECARRDSRCTSRTRASMRTLYRIEHATGFGAARPGRARQCVIKRIFNRSPVPVRPRLLFQPLRCRFVRAPLRGAGPLNICPRPPARCRPA